MEEEDLEHFLVRCPELNRKKNQEVIKTETPMTSEEKTTHILFRNKNHKKVAYMIRSMWEYRKYRKDNLRPP